MFSMSSVGTKIWQCKAGQQMLLESFLLILYVKYCFQQELQNLCSQHNVIEQSCNGSSFKQISH